MTVDKSVTPAFLLDHFPDGILIVNSEGVVQYANAHAISVLTGRKPLRIGETVNFPIPPEGLTEVDVSELVGEHRLLEFRTSNLEMGGARYLLIWMRDITERSQTENALRESLLQYRVLIENSSDPIFVLQQERFVLVNPAWERLFGYRASEALDDDFNPGTIIAPEWKEFVNSYFQQQERGNVETRKIGFRGLTRGGRLVDLELEAGQILWQQRMAVQGIFHDVTEHHERMKALVRSEEKYRALFDENRDIVFISTPAGRFVDINPAGVELLGYPSKEELLKVDIAKDLYVNPSTRLEYRKCMEEVGYVKDWDLIWRKRNNERIHLLETATTVRDEEGTIIAYRGILRDVTEQRRLQTQLAQAQRLESVGRLAGGIAHDFNNILAAVMGSAEMIKRYVADEEMERYASLVIQASKRGGDLAKQLLAFARLESYQLRPVTVATILDETIHLLEHTVKKSITIERRYTTPNVVINADAAQIQQVLLNIFVNARDAMPDGGTLSIELTTKYFDQDSEIDTARISPGQYVQINIKDTGMGMEELVRQKIFEPFFTTKGKGKGSGLGLSVAYGIIESHKGFISVESDVGSGTTFHISIPEYYPVYRPQVPEPDRSVTGKGNSLRVLVIDDEEMVRMISEGLLTSLGHACRVVSGGEDALAVLKEAPGEFDCILLDLAMPGMDGRETYRRIRDLDKNIPVVIVSGLIEPEHRMEMDAAGVAAFIQKPFGMTELSKTLHQIGAAASQHQE